MKNFYFLVSGLSLLLMVHACTQKEDKYIDTPPLKNLESVQQIEVLDGILRFKTTDAFDQITQSFNNQSENTRVNWERNIGFVSFNTLVNQVYGEINEATQQQEISDILKTNSHLVMEETSNGQIFIQPVLRHPLYSKLCNIDGLYVINKNVYKVISNFLIVSALDNLLFMKSLKESDISNLNDSDFQIFNIDSPSRKKITSTFMTAYYDPDGCNSDRCIVTTMGTALDTYRNQNNQTLYKTTVYVDVETWRKSFVCSWYKYPNIIYMYNVSYTYELGGWPPISDSWPDYTSSSAENGVYRFKVIYDWGLNPVIPNDMTQMHVDATHGGMHGIWCTIDY